MNLNKFYIQLMGTQNIQVLKPSIFILKGLGARRTQILMIQIPKRLKFNT